MIQIALIVIAAIICGKAFGRRNLPVILGIILAVIACVIGGQTGAYVGSRVGDVSNVIGGSLLGTVAGLLFSSVMCHMLPVRDNDYFDPPGQ